MMKIFDEFRETIRTLRSENGCPWDRKQTHASLKKTAVEEAAEVIGGVDILEQTGNPDNLKEELGDLLMQIVMHAQIAEEEGLFTMEDVIAGINEKMIFRHPHVFSGLKVEADQINDVWLRQKAREHEGTEWQTPYTADGFIQAKKLLERGEYRKGFAHLRAEQRIQQLQLQKHPEGGWFSEVYTASTDFGTVETDRPCGGSIYFLLEGNDVSHFHVIDCDELWYYHEGCGTRVHFITEDGQFCEHLLGMGEGMEPMVYVPKGVIFAAECLEEKGYTLMSCATLPAFRYSGFRLVPQEELLVRYPEEKERIVRLAFKQEELPAEE